MFFVDFLFYIFKGSVKGFPVRIWVLDRVMMSPSHQASHSSETTDDLLCDEFASLLLFSSSLPSYSSSFSLGQSRIHSHIGNTTQHCHSILVPENVQSQDTFSSD